MHLIQEIGSYAGLAAIPGLAVLAALYFSQARDVKRLREWAGRAPERAAEQAAGGRAATQAAVEPARAAQPAAQPAAQQAVQPAAQAARAAAGGAAVAATGTATAAPARPGTGTLTHPPTTTPPPPRRIAPTIPSEGGYGRTAVLGTAPPVRDPWYRRIADRLPPGRYLALIVAGILIVGGGAAYGITQLASSSKSTTATPSGGSPSRSAAVVPSQITVAVLNATAVPNLARTIGHKLERNSFKLGNLNNAVGGQRAHSVVLFKPGANKAAGLVARKLHIDKIQPADRQSLARAGNATVIVVVGADKAPPAPPQPQGGGGTGGGGAGAGGGTGAGTGGGTATPGAGVGTPGAGTATPGAGTGTGAAGTGGTGTGTPGAGGTGVPGQ